jgi:hypothetical protein
MNKPLSRQEIAQQAYLEEAKKSRAGRLEEAIKNFEKMGVSSGLWMKRFKNKNSPAALAAFSRAEFALATMIGGDLAYSNTARFSDVVNGLKQVSANIDRALVDHSHLTPAFDGAQTSEAVVSLAAFQKLKEAETSFEKALYDKSCNEIPDLQSCVHEAFDEFLHHTAADSHLRVLFDRETGEVNYAHDQARVDQLMANAKARSPHRDNASIRVMTFTASANADQKPTNTATATKASEAPAPHYRIAS